MGGLRPARKSAWTRALCTTAGLLFSASAFSQGDGPRAYQLVPEGTQSLSQFLFALRGNNTPSNGLVIEDADIDINLGVTQYARAFDIDGHQAGLLAVIPYGEVSGSLATLVREKRGNDSGLGDLMLGFVYGVYGSPNVSRQEYLEFNPGFAMAVLARATLPTGSYNSDQFLNMGSNRWALELGVPLMYYLGEAYIDSSLMSFELLPKVTLFTENDDATGSANRLEQDPLLSLEGHLTRNFGQAVWVSLDMFYEYGGETETDGVENGDKMRSFSLGLSAALNLSPGSSVKVSYGEVVSGNPSGSDAEMLRIQFMLLF